MQPPRARRAATAVPWPDLSAGLREPLPRSLLSDLRRAVLDHAVSERRRAFSPILHHGVPGGPAVTCALDPRAVDPALLVDVIEALVGRTEREGGPAEDRRLLWLTRPGELDPQDVDLCCLAAARSAGGEQGLALPLVVVTRHGWRDPGTGAQRTWKRIRVR